MQRRSKGFAVLALAATLALAWAAAGAPETRAAQGSGDGTVGVDVLLREAPDGAILAELGQYGRVAGVLPEIKGVHLVAKASAIDRIRELPFVAAAGPDRVRVAGPVATEATGFASFSGGLAAWDLDAIGVGEEGRPGRLVAEDGRGVYVAVVDTGLLKDWRDYLPESHVAVEYARSFGGGGAAGLNVSEQPHKWERDQNSHGIHVTSTILGYDLGGVPIGGVAPEATVIPVKVLNQNGSGWSSVVAAGILYVADLKAGPLKDSPVVINMSLGGPGPDPLEEAAIDYAISQGVIVVAAAGNAGEAGMDFPGAYPPVISAAAAGWTGEWVGGANWWILGDVPDPTDPGDFYIAGFSSRALPGQDLDVAAPGSWVVGPYQVNGQHSYYFLGGTSMATPHVAGTVALMAQKDPGLTAAQAEAILEATAVPLGPGCRNVIPAPGLSPAPVCWGADATGAGLLDAQAALGATP